MQQMFMTYVIFAETFENIIRSALNVKLFIKLESYLTFSISNHLFCYTNPVALVFGLLFVVCVQIFKLASRRGFPFQVYFQSIFSTALACTNVLTFSISFFSATSTVLQTVLQTVNLGLCYNGKQTQVSCLISYVMGKLKF